MPRPFYIVRSTRKTLNNKKIFIAVIGGAEPTPEEAVVAEAVGRELAKRGAVLVCGGLGGVMEAACKGACTEGGLTIGILPGNSRNMANPYVQIPIATGRCPCLGRLAASHAFVVEFCRVRWGALGQPPSKRLS